MTRWNAKDLESAFLGEIGEKPFSARECISSIALLYVPLGLQDTVQWLALRLSTAAQLACACGETELKLEDSLMNGLMAVESTASGVANESGTGERGYWRSDTVQELLEPLAAKVDLDRRTFCTLVESDAASLEPSVGDELREAYDLFTASFSVSGIERGELHREVRNHLHRVVGDPKGSQMISGWLMLGHLSFWMLGLEGVEGIFQKAIGAIGKRRDFLAVNLNRTFACWLSLQDMNVRALTFSMKAVELSPSWSTLYETAVYAAQAKSVDVTKACIAKASQQFPLSTIIFLSDPLLKSFVSSIVESMDNLKSMTAATAQAAVVKWQGCLAKIQQAEDSSDIAFDSTCGTHVTPKALLDELPTATFLQALGIASAAHRAEKQAQEGANILVANELAARNEMVEEVTRAIAEAKRAHERDLEISARYYQQLMDHATERMNKSLSEGNRAQHGCGLAMAVSAATMVAFIGISMFLSFRGLETGFQTPLGMACLTIAGIPIVLSLSAQVAHGVKRMSLEAELARKKATSQETLDRARSEADQSLGNKLSDLQEKLVRSELLVKRAEEASQILAGGSLRLAQPISKAA